MARSVLVIKAANGSTLDAAVPLSVLSGKADGAISVTTRSFHGPPDALPEADSSMDAVVLAGLPTELPLKMFHEVLRVLVPGGMVQTSYLVSEHTIAKTEETVNSDLLMGGFVGSASVISTLRSQASVQLSVSFTATKPSYGADGGAQKLRLGGGAQKLRLGGGAQKLTPRKPAAEATPMDDDDDLVDEDELLDMAPAVSGPAEPRKEDDCETGKGACANCSCGRAEAIYDEKAAQDAPSACGNCYLGDGFRCDGCPHKGKPPFEPGETPADDQDMDTEAESAVATESAGGKVTLASMDDDLDFD